MFHLSFHPVTHFLLSLALSVIKERSQIFWGNNDKYINALPHTCNLELQDKPYPQSHNNIEEFCKQRRLQAYWGAVQGMIRHSLSSQRTHMQSFFMAVILQEKPKELSWFKSVLELLKKCLPRFLLSSLTFWVSHFWETGASKFILTVWNLLEQSTSCVGTRLQKKRANREKIFSLSICG